MSHFEKDEAILDAENVGVKNADIGAKRPGRVLVSPHQSRRAGRWTGIDKHERDYPDVWDHKGQWNEVGAEPSHIRSFVKDGKVCVVMMLDGPGGAKLMLGTCVPIPEGEDPATLGWGWGSIKSAAKSLGRSAKYGAGKLMKVAKSPEFQSMVKTAAPAALTAFGVPPWATAAAMKVVDRGRGGDPTAVRKVQRIRTLAQQQYPPAQQLYGVMSSYYRGGVPGVMQAPPYGYPIPSQYGGYQMPSPRMPYGMQPQMPPQMQQYRQPQYPQQQFPQMPYGMQQFRIPTQQYGMVSGWLYNIPVRGAIEAALQSPTLKVRGLYKQGMVGALATDDVGIKAYQIGAARPGDVLVSSHQRRIDGKWTGIEHHKRGYPDVWDYKGQWAE
jgi:hypothetical protein